jgi:dienelactone hydrolase
MLRLLSFLPFALAGIAQAAELRPITASSPAEWPAKRAAIVKAAESYMGALPGAEKRCPLDVRVEKESDEGTYLRRLITYASEPGDRTPAWLLIPKTALAGKPAPAVLCLHPTDNTIGHDVVVGLGGKANRAYAKELAEQGYVTIAPSYPHLAKYYPDLKALGWASGTMKAIWNHVRALDLLDAMPEVRHGSYGVIGHSLGGHNSIFAAVFDPRIKAVVTSCGFDSFQDYYAGDAKNWVVGRGWCQERYMPRLAGYAGKLDQIPADYHELLAAIAPRPVFVNAPLGDANFQHASVDRVVAAARPVYQLLGAPDAIKVVHPDCPHDFPEEARREAYALFDRTLRN